MMYALSNVILFVQLTFFQKFHASLSLELTYRTNLFQFSKRKGETDIFPVIQKFYMQIH